MHVTGIDTLMDSIIFIWHQEIHWLSIQSTLFLIDNVKNYK